MKRVSIIGSSGAGKSSLAIKIAVQTNLPLFHLDRLFWNPGWVETPRKEFREMQKKIVIQEKWIIDGNYDSTFDERLPFADTIIFLDFSRALCLYRVLIRQIIFRKKKRSDISEGCEERLSREFLAWVWNFPKVGRLNIYRHISTLQHSPEILIFRRPKDVKRWLEHLS